MREQTRAFTMFIKWLGFKQTSVPVEEDARFEGKSSYNFKKKLNLALEIITTQSNRPLLFSVKIGFIIALIALFYIVFLVIRNLFVGDLTLGWTTIIASIYLMGGVLLCAVGLVGLYVGNIFNETKNRPIYVVAEILNEH